MERDRKYMDNLPDNLIVKGVFKDIYNLYLKYHGIPESYEKWEKIKEDVDKVNQKYKKCEIAIALCIALLNQLKYEDKKIVELKIKEIKY